VEALSDAGSIPAISTKFEKTVEISTVFCIIREGIEVNLKLIQDDSAETQHKYRILAESKTERPARN